MSETKIKSVLLLGQPQCPMCYAVLDNRLIIDVNDYLNNLAIFIHPASQLCKNANLATEEFKLSDFIQEILPVQSKVIPFSEKDNNDLVTS